VKEKASRHGSAAVETAPEKPKIVGFEGFPSSLPKRPANFWKCLRPSFLLPRRSRPSGRDTSTGNECEPQGGKRGEPK